MSAVLELVRTPHVAALDRPIRILPVPWRDPHSVSPAELAEYIGFLENACGENPRSADLRTCLGMAYAMNFEVYKSMDALEAAVDLDPVHFFARMKYAELFYRLRALARAEEEAIQAVNLAGNGWELSLGRKLLTDIREKRRNGTQKPAFDKPLAVPALSLVALIVVLCSLLMVLK